MIRNPVKRLVCVGLVLAALSVRGGTLARFRTVLGDIEVELFDQHKPATVQNFIRYVQAGRYTNSFIHRCDPDFVIQGGGFWVTNRSGTNPDFAAVPQFPAIRNEYTNGAIYSNVYGTIAMARQGGVTNSATSQWFFNLANNSFLDSMDGGFTVFGRVVRGTNVLETFKTFSTTNLFFNVIANLGIPFNELPILTAAATYDDLIYADVSLLNLRARRLANGNCRVSWNSIAGKTNRVEYSVRMPAVNWQLLLATNGTGATIGVTDATTNAVRRYYRVRVDY